MAEDVIKVSALRWKDDDHCYISEQVETDSVDDALDCFFEMVNRNRRKQAQAREDER